MQYSNDSALKFVLEDPERTGLSVIAVAVVSLSIVTFLVIFGILQFRSKKRMKYSKISVESNGRTEDDDECNESLIDGEEDRA